MYYLWVISEALLESLVSLGSSPLFSHHRQEKRLAEYSLQSFISVELARHYIEEEFPPLFAKIRQEHGLREMDASALHAAQAGFIQLKVELSQGVRLHSTYGYNGGQILKAMRTEVVSILDEGSHGKLARMERTAPYWVSRSLGDAALRSRLELASDVEVHNYFECPIRFGKFSFIRPDEVQLDLFRLSKAIETLSFAGEKQAARLAEDIPVLSKLFADAAEKRRVLVFHETDEGYDYE